MQAPTFDAPEYLPTAHAVQTLAPALVPVLVSEPAGHSVQSVTSFEPVASLYRLAGQLMQASTFDAVEYFPTAHAVHVVAPVLVPASVIEPAAQSVHASTFDAVEYVRAGHAVHELAPADVPVLAIEPATHALQ